MAAIQNLLSNAMTVEDLIEFLQQYDPKSKVVFTSDYGDICHTQQCHAVQMVGDLDEMGGVLKESAYSNSGVALEEAEYIEECDEIEVVVIS